MSRGLKVLGLLPIVFAGAAHAAGASSIGDSGIVSIHPGEAFEIVFPDRNDLAHPKFSRVLDHVDQSVQGYRRDNPDAAKPAGPALMSFELVREEGRLILYIRNDSGLAIKYRAAMTVETPSGERTAHTSICPSLPGVLGTEQWTDPIATLELSGFHEADPSQFSCD